MARIKALYAGILLASTGLAASGAFGLELGNITLSSALNEPLAASIELESLAGVQASAISVRVGDQAAYDQADIERTPLLDSISFVVEVDNDDEGRIVLRSAQAVTEPYLNLIVAVSDPRGLTQQEYTLLLDLPPSAAVAARNALSPPQASAPVNNAPAPARNNDSDTYTVAPGDTLWEIAQNTRPDTSIGVERMMLAIQRANSSAFIGGNINRLISGRVLRMPSRQDIDLIDQSSALAQIAEQNSALGGQPLATGGGTAGTAAADTRDQLSVLSGDAPTAGSGSSDLAATIAALENELMLSEENLDRARIENLELNNRLASLQEQIDLLENIIAIEDERIAQLQAELSEQANATAQALASADTAATALDEVNSAPASAVTGLLRNTVVLVGVLAALAVAVLGLLVHRRRQAQIAAEENHFNPALDDSDDFVYEEQEEKLGLLAGLLARFRRKEAEEDDADIDLDDDLDDDDDDDDDYEDDGVLDAEAPAAATADSRDELLDDIDLDDDLLDDALDDSDALDEESAEAFAPIEDSAPVQDAELATDEVEIAQSLDDDYALNAATEAFATVDELAAEVEGVEDGVEFRAPEAVATPAAPEAAAAEVEPAETFEFTLKDLPDLDVAVAAASDEPIETFDFNASVATVAEPAPETAAAAATGGEMEVIAFPHSAAATPSAAPVVDAPVAQASAAAPAEELSLELGELNFDDTMLSDDEEESTYKPRTGNECDTKLDLATAYEAMGDVVEAIEILDEVIAEGSPEQIETAQRLKATWQASL